MKMHNILLSQGINYLDRFSNNAKIIVKDDSILNVINLGLSLDLDISIEKNSKLTLNIFDFDENIKINIKVQSDDNSKFIMNSSFIAEGLYEMNIDANLYGNNIVNEVNIRGINEKNGNVKITMNGLVAGETNNNVISEYAKIINKSDESNVLIPNLIVNTCDVVANHGVSVGTYDKDELFYLRCKGLSLENAKRIIEEGFLLSIMDDDMKEKIKNILLGR